MLFCFQENADPQKMAFLLRKQWALYSVTPLYKFSYANMKEYSRHLSAFVAAEKQKGLAMVVGIDLSIKVIFSTLLGLKGTDRDQAAILVQVRTKLSLLLAMMHLLLNCLKIYTSVTIHIFM